MSGRESVLTLQLYPPIILEETKSYELGLINLVTYNTIPNVDSSNNSFYFGATTIRIPEGTYEINDIAKIVSDHVRLLKPNLPPSIHQIKKIASSSYA